MDASENRSLDFIVSISRTKRQPRKLLGLNKLVAAERERERQRTMSEGPATVWIHKQAATLHYVPV